MDNRIKKIRQALNMTQQEFANKIGIKRGTIANYEIGRNFPVDSVISLICREFNVNENWLRNGNGSMFIEPSEFSLDKYAEQKNLTMKEKKILQGFMDLDPDVRNAICAIFENAATLDNNLSGSDGEDLYNNAPDSPQELEKLFPPVSNTDFKSNIS